MEGVAIVVGQELTLEQMVVIIDQMKPGYIEVLLTLEIFAKPHPPSW
jgi:hypothetical protein